MRNKSLVLQTFMVATAGLLLASAPEARADQHNKSKSQLSLPADRSGYRVEELKEEVRHQLVMLPYYSVFDWLQAEIKHDGTVALMGEVTRPTLKNDAISRVNRIEAATRSVDSVEVLPLSAMDDGLRVALYRAIYNYNSPLFWYATQSVPPIHIIVRNGHVSLKGVVASQMDSQLAYAAASQVPGVFEVKNELQIEQRLDEKVSRK